MSNTFFITLNFSSVLLLLNSLFNEVSIKHMLVVSLLFVDNVHIRTTKCRLYVDAVLIAMLTKIMVNVSSKK